MRTKITVLILLSYFIAPAQIIPKYEEFPDLFDLYVFGDYEKCLKKAERYSDQDRYRREPRPYLYAAKCYYQLFNNPEKYDQYIEERPIKEALKYAYRFMKRDKYDVVIKGQEPFFEELKVAGLKKALYLCQQEEYRKSAYYLKKLAKVYPEDYVIRMTLAMGQTMSRNKYEGKRNFEMALKQLHERMEARSLKPVDVDIKPHISAYLQEYYDYWKELENGSKAIQTISIAHLVLGDRSKFWEEYQL